MLAHAGKFTWDEVLIVLAPLVVIAALLGLARRRVRAQHSRRSGSETGAQDTRSMSAPSDANLPTKSS